MVFLHVSDLHIGRRLNGYSLLEDQRHILEQILGLLKAHSVDALLIAGDVYDSNVPSAEAVTLLDWFLTTAAGLGVSVFAIAGNHDSSERLSFGRALLGEQGLHLSPVFDGAPKPCVISDDLGEINIYLLPYMHKAQIRTAYGQSFATTEEGVRCVIDSISLDASKRNILLAHLFVTAGGREPILSDSEVKNVGGIDNVDASVFQGFDYVALGHIHGPYPLEKGRIHYSGSPLKYSVSEQFHHKQALLVTVGEKGKPPLVEPIYLKPLRDLRQIKGPMDMLLKNPPSEDYVSVVLTDETRRIDPMNRFKAIYPNCLSVEYAAELRTEGESSQTFASGDVSRKKPMEIFEEFFKARNGTPLPAEDRAHVERILERLLEEE